MYIHTYVCVCMYVRICVCVCTHILYVCTYVCMYKHSWCNVLHVLCSTRISAHVLAKEQGRNFGDDIAAAIRVAKRKVNSLQIVT